MKKINNLKRFKSCDLGLGTHLFVVMMCDVTFLSLCFSFCYGIVFLLEGFFFAVSLFFFAVSSPSDDLSLENLAKLNII